MRNEEIINIENGVTEQVKERVRTTGVSRLTIEQAQKLGVIDRISYLTCTMHACISAAYMVFGDIDNLLTQMGSKKHEIKRACNDLDTAFDKYLSFWRINKYQTREGSREMGAEVDALFHQLMRWAQIPEEWQPGDAQHTADDADVMLRVDTPDREYTFRRTTVESNPLEDVEETWCVTRFDPKEKTQTTVNVGMDKASAQMVAKRLSSEDTERIYTASIMQTISERRVDVLPMKAYRGNELVSDVRKVLRRN